MASADTHFEERLRRLAQKRHRQSAGVVRQIGDDGLIMVVPRRRRRRITFPLRSLAFVLCFGLLFKALFLAHLGEARYSERVDALRDGNIAERAGAYLMLPDPATRAIVQTWGAYLP